VTISSPVPRRPKWLCTTGSATDRCFGGVLQNTCPLASLVGSYSDVACEPTGLLPGHPTLRPADVGILLVDGSTTALPVTHLLLDFTSISMPPILHPPPHPPIATNDPYPLSVVQHHETGENKKKFVGRSRTNIPAGQVTTAILDNGYCLMPCTFDPGRQLGPFFNSIFWPPGSQPTATLPLSTTRSPRSLSNDPARRAATLAYDLCPDLGILTKADRTWRQTQGSTW
jgi:hypothetical protein